jgi:hypothetical protein
MPLSSAVGRVEIIVVRDTKDAGAEIGIIVISKTKFKNVRIKIFH